MTPSRAATTLVTVLRSRTASSGSRSRTETIATPPEKLTPAHCSSGTKFKILFFTCSLRISPAFAQNLTPHASAAARICRSGIDPFPSTSTNQTRFGAYKTAKNRNAKAIQKGSRRLPRAKLTASPRRDRHRQRSPLLWASCSNRRQVRLSMVMVRVKGAVNSGSRSLRPWAP